MDNTQKYFIHLLSSYLNNSPPLPDAQADWMGVFKLGELHNVTAMLCISIRKLPAESKPPAKIMGYFNQALGMTLQSYESKAEGIKLLTNTFNDNSIPHMFVKGAAIRQLYPYGEVRTSGDTDVIVKSEHLNIAADILSKQGFNTTQSSDVQRVLFYKDEEFEVKTYLDGVNAVCENYFSQPFDNKSINISGSTYYLKDTYHLIYIISHLLRHLTIGGVGIRQLMDVDVLLRNGNVDFKKFCDIVNQLGILRSSMVLISLSKEYFNTPIEAEYKVDEELKNSLETVMLSGGVFGYAISDHGTGRLVKSINSSNNKGKKSSIKALFMMIFPSKEYLYNTYKYSGKCHLLLPVAFFHRLFDAVFKRGKSNRKAVKNLFENNETAIMISDIINELNIEL